MLNDWLMRSPIRIAAREAERARRLIAGAFVVSMTLGALLFSVYEPPAPAAGSGSERFHSVKVSLVSGASLRPGPSPSRAAMSSIAAPAPQAAVLRPVLRSEPIATPVLTLPPSPPSPTGTLSAQPAPPMPPPPPPLVAGDGAVSGGSGSGKGSGAGAPLGGGGGNGLAELRPPGPPQGTAARTNTIPPPRVLTPEELERLRKEREAAAAAAAAAQAQSILGRGKTSFQEIKAQPAK